jgi:hypothetical protein
VSDPLKALLDWVANESGEFLACDQSAAFHDHRKCLGCLADARFDAIRKAWLDAGCPSRLTQPEPVPAGKLRVRIAVVQRGSIWAADGDSESSDQMKVTNAKQILEALEEHVDLEGPDFVSFVEADVPLPPRPKTIEGRVTT